MRLGGDGIKDLCALGYVSPDIIVRWWCHVFGYVSLDVIVDVPNRSCKLVRGGYVATASERGMCVCSVTYRSMSLSVGVAMCLATYRSMSLSIGGRVS